MFPCFVRTAPSTELICPGFQTPSSYSMPARPETSTVNWLRTEFHEFEITRKVRLVLPSEGSSFANAKPKSFFNRMTKLFGPPETAKRSTRCWSSSLGWILNGRDLPFISTDTTFARKLSAGENSTQQSPVPLRVVSRVMVSDVLRYWKPTRTA